MDDYVQYQGKRLDEAEAANVRGTLSSAGSLNLDLFGRRCLRLALRSSYDLHGEQLRGESVRRGKLRKAHQDLEAKVITERRRYSKRTTAANGSRGTPGSESACVNLNSGTGR